MLHVAAAQGLVGMVTKLLNAGADIDAMTNKAMSPLMVAAASGHCDVVRTLVSAGANVEGVNAVVDAAHDEGMLSDVLHHELGSICACDPGCVCCANGCQCGM